MLLLIVISVFLKVWTLKLFQLWKKIILEACTYLVFIIEWKEDLNIVWNLEC